MPDKIRATPMDYVCLHCGVFSLGSGLHGLHYVAAGEAHASVVAYNMSCRHCCHSDRQVVDVVDTTSLVMNTSGLMTSGQHS